MVQASWTKFESNTGIKHRATIQSISDKAFAKHLVDLGGRRLNTRENRVKRASAIQEIVQECKYFRGVSEDILGLIQKHLVQLATEWANKNRPGNDSQSARSQSTTPSSPGSVSEASDSGSKKARISSACRLSSGSISSIPQNPETLKVRQSSRPQNDAGGEPASPELNGTQDTIRVAPARQGNGRGLLGGYNGLEKAMEISDNAALTEGSLGSPRPLRRGQRSNPFGLLLKTASNGTALSQYKSSFGEALKIETLSGMAPNQRKDLLGEANITETSNGTATSLGSTKSSALPPSKIKLTQSIEVPRPTNPLPVPVPTNTSTRTDEAKHPYQESIQRVTFTGEPKDTNIVERIAYKRRMGLGGSSLAVKEEDTDTVKRVLYKRRKIIRESSPAEEEDTDVVKRAAEEDHTGVVKGVANKRRIEGGESSLAPKEGMAAQTEGGKIRNEEQNNGFDDSGLVKWVAYKRRVGGGESSLAPKENMATQSEDRKIGNGEQNERLDDSGLIQRIAYRRRMQQ